MELEWPEWDLMIGNAMKIEKSVYDKKNKSGQGVSEGDLLAAYEEIIRTAYLETGNCTEEDITTFCGYFSNKLGTVLQEKIKDGYMGWENFKEMMLDDKAAYVAIMFKKYDLNDDGKITPEERQEIQEKMANECPIHATKMSEFFAFMMANFDTDGDGIISEEEFLTGVRSWMGAKSKKICG